MTNPNDSLMDVLAAGIFGVMAGVWLGAWIYHRARIGASPLPDISFRRQKPEPARETPILISRP